jgi:glycosyltransferase involved in cell wall biosynthesis
MIISKNPLRVVATLLARDEEDIIARNIEHHLEHGVSQIILTDNMSKDRTREIAAKYKEVVEIIEAKEDDHRQSEWVTRMARLACKLKPDWIIHLDADELWCGLSQLRTIQGEAFGSTKMFLHPPHTSGDMRHYLNFEGLGLPGECKIGHRPNENVVIDHGNHGCNLKVDYTTYVWRHHYPIRSCKQFIRKTVDGHEALLRRKSICERWQKWYNLYLDGSLGAFYEKICGHWESMIREPNTEDLLVMLDMWSTSEVVDMFKRSGLLPAIGEWPRRVDAQQGVSD